MYHPACASNFEACLTVLEDLCIPGLTCSDLLGPNTNFLITVNVKVGFVSFDWGNNLAFRWLQSEVFFLALTSVLCQVLGFMLWHTSRGLSLNGIENPLN